MNKASTEVLNPENLVLENKKLMKENAAYKRQLSELDAKVNMILQNSNLASQVVPAKDEDEGDDTKISGDTYIKVMSLCPTGHELNLCTQRKGGGKVFNFQKFGEVKRILYRDLNDILDINMHFLEEGKFIVLNLKVVKRHGLDAIYAKILTKEMIEQVVLGENQTDAINLFKSAPLAQQEFIIQLICSKALGGQELDLNLLDRLSRTYSFDSENQKIRPTIQEKIEEMKAYREINKTQ